MERRFGNQSLFTNPPSESFYPTDRNTPAGDQTLESSLSRLTLSSSSPPFNPNERYSPLLFQTNGLRVQNAVNGRMGFGFGGTGVNPPVGPQMGSYPTAESELWRTTYSGVDSSFGFNQGPGLVSESGSGSHLNSPYSHDFFDSARLSSINQNLGGSYLQPKKQLGNQYNSQIPVLPFVKKNNFLGSSGPSGQNFDGFMRMKSYNLGTSSLNQCPQFMNGCSLENLRGQIVRMAKDQYGSRLLQTTFEDPKEDEIEMVLSEVIDHLGELVGDQFGNYIVQKLVKVCSEKQRTLMICAITKTQFQLISICLDPHGTRVVQRLLENITSKRQISLVMSALSPGAVVLATDPNGHHVIQHCLIHFSNEDNKACTDGGSLIMQLTHLQLSAQNCQSLFCHCPLTTKTTTFAFQSKHTIKFTPTNLVTEYLLKGIANNCLQIATNKHGCCVLQSCVDHFQGEYRESLVAEIIANAIHLAEDPYGNYVVQHLLGLKTPGIKENLVMQFEGSFVSLSCNKYASNVVEKCFTESGEEISSQILMEFIRSPDISMLLIDPFGNFVIQSALSVSKGVIRSALLNLIRANAPTLRSNPYGKKVLDWFDKIMSQHA